MLILAIQTCTIAVYAITVPTDYVVRGPRVQEIEG